VISTNVLSTNLKLHNVSFSIWVIVSSLGRIVVAITTMIWGGKDCEAKKEVNSINN